MSATQDFFVRNDSNVDKCDRCQNHFNCLNPHNGKQYCDRCIGIVKKKEGEKAEAAEE